MFFKFFSRVVGVTNVFEEFVSVLSTDVKEDFGSTWVIVEVFGDIVYFWTA
jgi:hypothetical protein